MKKKILSILLTIIFIIFFAKYINSHLEDFKIIKNIDSYIEIFFISILTLSTFYINGLFLKITLQRFGLDLKFIEYFSLSLISTFANIFIPLKGGAGIKAIYLKKKYNLNYSKFISSFAGNFILVISTNSVVMFLIMLILYFNSNILNIPIFLFFTLMMLVSSYIIISKKELQLPSNRFFNKIQSILDNWYVIKRSGNTIFKLYIISIINVIIIAILLFVEFKAFNLVDTNGETISIIKSSFLSLVRSISMLISLTPAALGIKEGLMMLVSGSVNINPSHSLAVSILERVVVFIELLILAPILTIILKNKMRKK